VEEMSADAQNIAEDTSKMSIGTPNEQMKQLQKIGGRESEI
jgi:hypothetical protein